MKKNTKKTLRILAGQVKNHKILTIFLLLSLTIAVLLTLVLPFFYKEFVNALTSGESQDLIFEKLIRIIIYILILDIIYESFWRITGFLNNRFQPVIIRDLYNECTSYLHRHSYNFFNNNFGGALVKRVNRMVNAFEGLADRLTWDAIPLVIRIIVITAVLTYLHPYMGISIVIWTIFYVLFSYLLAQYKLKYDLAKAEADTKITACLSDSITNNANIKLFSGHEFEAERFEKVNNDWYHKAKKQWDLGTWIEVMQSIMMTILEITIFYIMANLWRRGVLSVGDFVLIQAYLLEVFMNLWGFGRVIRDVQERIADAEEMTIILTTPHQVRDKREASDLVVKNGQIEFKNVTFSYGNSTDVIKNLSLKIKPSEKIALIGPSGGGKTTITKLLLRLFDIDKGKILIDGHDISKVTQDSLRREVSLVPQDPILFHRSLMDNIRYGRRSASNEEVIAAAKMANAHKFIMSFPRKYNTFVGERGVKLSGGERQRIAIARAILANTKILILDEATSQLDSESEKLIQDALKNLMKHKTTLIIAHRLSTVMSTDRVFVIKSGKILEEGSHASLVNENGSLYKKLWDLQVGGYFEE